MRKTLGKQVSGPEELSMGAKIDKVELFKFNRMVEAIRHHDSLYRLLKSRKDLNGSCTYYAVTIEECINEFFNRREDKTNSDNG